MAVGLGERRLIMDPVGGFRLDRKVEKPDGLWDPSVIRFRSKDRLRKCAESWTVNKKFPDSANGVWDFLDCGSESFILSAWY